MANALRASRVSRASDMVSLGRHRGAGDLVLMSFEELVAYSVGWRRAARTSMLSRSSSQTYRFRGMESLREMFGYPRLLHQEIYEVSACDASGSWPS